MAMGPGHRECGHIWEEKETIEHLLEDEGFSQEVVNPLVLALALENRTLFKASLPHFPIQTLYKLLIFFCGGSRYATI